MPSIGPVGRNSVEVALSPLPPTYAAEIGCYGDKDKGREHSHEKRERVVQEIKRGGNRESVALATWYIEEETVEQ